MGVENSVQAFQVILADVVHKTSFLSYMCFWFRVLAKIKGTILNFDASLCLYTSSMVLYVQ